MAMSRNITDWEENITSSAKAKQDSDPCCTPSSSKYFLGSLMARFERCNSIRILEPLSVALAGVCTLKAYVQLSSTRITAGRQILKQAGKSVQYLTDPVTDKKFGVLARDTLAQCRLACAVGTFDSCCCCANHR